jgi:hypothetical protein
MGGDRDRRPLTGARSSKLSYEALIYLKPSSDRRLQSKTGVPLQHENRTIAIRTIPVR